LQVNLYWSILILTLGGCIGSFLNVVIYRWPRGLSVRQPRRSFCPVCEASIAWYDNIPVISFLLLRGRCRHCGCAISLQYPLVELATAFVFLMVYDAFFVAQMREGVETLSSDWPIVLGHWVLFGGLIALSVMDLEAYTVDIRLTWIITLAGLITHTLWTPASHMTHAIAVGLNSEYVHSIGWIRPGLVQAGLAFGAVIGLLVGAILFLRGQSEYVAEAHLEVVEEPLPDDLSAEKRFSWQWLWLIVLIALVIVYLVAMLTGGVFAAPAPADLPGDRVGQQATMPLDAGMIRLMAGIAAAFVALALVASHPQPQADADIMDAIESEADGARGNALWELKLLLPAIVCGTGVVVAIVLADSPADRHMTSQVLHWTPTGQWQPLWGLATGLVGWIIGGAIGWLARIVFTLAFGKEALGMGDVHILAAAGAVAGWPVALLGFFLAAPLALLAIVVIAIRRQSRALPYGPWLALAFFAAGLFQDRILRYFHIRWMLE